MGERVPVLLVDDEPAIRNALRDWLADEGYTVLEADDGIEALYILDHTSTAVVVVTDHAMPRLDGRGLIACVLSSAELSKRAALVYMTAGGHILSPAFAGELQTLGVPVLRKPFELDELTRVVADIEARLQAQLQAHTIAAPESPCPEGTR